MRSGKWWPWTAAWGLAAATVAVVVNAGVRVSAAGRSLSPAETITWLVAGVTLGGGVVAAFRWASKKTHDPPGRLPWERIRTAKRLLADAVDEYWKKEARYRDWEKPPLIQVRWRRPTDPCVPSHTGAVKNPLKTASSADIPEVAEKFRACEPRRLVILGGPGTGKTTLAVRLLLQLLATRARREDEPVPVALPMAQWDTRRYPRLHAWLSEQLYQDYPGLRWLGVSGIRQLVDLGHVLPILDGLDELPESAQTTVIRCLNDSLGPDDQLILTSRTEEYADAVGDGRALDASAVLEPLPVTPLASADYLKSALHSHQENRSAWARALRVLRTEPSSALARVAATPLGLWLLRTAYIKGDGDPDELTDSARFPTSDKLRAHLLGHLVVALLPPVGDKDRAKSLGLSRDYQAEDVERWLGFLAHHLSNQPSQHAPDHHGTRDFEWWRLAATTGRTPSPGVLGVTFGLVGGLTFGLTFGHVVGLVLGFVLGLGLVLGLGPEAARSAAEPPGVADLRVARIFISFGYLLVFALVFGLTFALALGLVVGLALGHPVELAHMELPGDEDLRAARRGQAFIPTLWSTLLFGLVSGFVSGLVGGLVGKPVASLVFGLVVGLVFGLARGVFGWLETPSPDSEAYSPQASLRSDRTLNLARIICGCIVFGLPAGLVFGFSAGLEPGLMFGLVGGLVFGPMLGLAGGRHRAWLAYVWANWRLSREGVLPRKLTPFLDDMHRLGLLRAVGRIYQFRHAELQDHLAEVYERAG